MTWVSCDSYLPDLASVEDLAGRTTKSSPAIEV